MTRFAVPLAITTLALIAAPAAAETVFIKADRLLDVERGRYLEAPLIKVVDGKVESVESSTNVPADTKLVDLSGKTLLPGLIDMHVHLNGRPEYSGYTGLQFTDRFWTVLGVANAEKMLKAGFTTVRNVGDKDYDVAGIDQAVEEGWIPGPRIVNANYALGATGGHCDETYLPPSFKAKSPGVANNPEASRRVCANNASTARRSSRSAPPAGSFRAIRSRARRSCTRRNCGRLRRKRISGASKSLPMRMARTASRTRFERGSTRSSTRA